MDSAENKPERVNSKVEKTYRIEIPIGVFNFVARNLKWYYDGQIKKAQVAGYFKGLYETSGSGQPNSEESRLLRLISTFSEQPQEVKKNLTVVGISSEDIDFVDLIIPHDSSSVVETRRRHYMNGLRSGLDSSKVDGQGSEIIGRAKRLLRVLNARKG